MAAKLVLAYAASAATLACCSAAGYPAPETVSRATFQVVLFGPYSNLARKYLWQALFELHEVTTAAGGSLDVRAASRDNVEAGAKKLTDIFTHNVTGDTAAKAAFQACCVRYYPIASDGDYAAFGDALAASELSDDSVAKVAVSAGGDSLPQQLQQPQAQLLSRAVYMSVAPDIVEGILRRLRVHGRVAFSANGGSVWDSSSAEFAGKHAVLPDGARLLTTPTRLLLEKPLGRDEASAVALLSGIERHLHSGTNADGSASSGILAIDHYLAKVGLLAAAGARSAALVAPEAGGAKGLLRSFLGGSAGDSDSGSYHSGFAASLQRMTAAMLESETAHGRTGFYNDYGAIRDVLQNHISLLAAASAVRSASDWSPAGRGAMLQRWRWGAGPLTTAEEDGRTALQATLADAKPALAAAMAAMGGMNHAAAPSTSQSGDGLTPLPQPHLPLRVGRYVGYAGHVAEEQSPATREAVAAAEAAAAAELAAVCAVDDGNVGDDVSASRSYMPWIWPPRSASGAAAGAAAAAFRAAHGGRSPAPREVFGSGFAGPTAADVRMRVHDAADGDGHDSASGSSSNGGRSSGSHSVPLRFIAGKAAGVRVAFAAHEFSVSPAADAAASAAPCAGLTYFHVQGTPLLPASLRNVMAAARLRGTGLVHRFASSSGPSILLAVWPNASAATGGAAVPLGRQQEPDVAAITACDVAAGELTRGAGEWWFAASAAAARASRAADAGAALAGTGDAASVGPFPSWAAWLSKWQLATLAPPGTGIGLVLLYPPDEDAEVQTARALDGDEHANNAARAAIASIAQRPSSTSAGAYKMIIAAGLAAHEAAFVSPSEAQRLWQLWGRAADTADAVVAAHTTNCTAALPQEALCRLHAASANGHSELHLTESAAFAEHVVGSSQWLLPGWMQL